MAIWNMILSATAFHAHVQVLLVGILWMKLKMLAVSNTRHATRRTYRIRLNGRQKSEDLLSAFAVPKISNNNRPNRVHIVIACPRFSTLAGATLLSACVIISGKIHVDIALHPPVFVLRNTKDCEIKINSGACRCIESKWIWRPNAITAVNVWFNWIQFNLWFVLVYAIAATMDWIQSEHSTPHDTQLARPLHSSPTLCRETVYKIKRT